MPVTSKMGDPVKVKDTSHGQLLTIMSTGEAGLNRSNVNGSTGTVLVKLEHRSGSNSEYGSGSSYLQRGDLDGSESPSSESCSEQYSNHDDNRGGTESRLNDFHSPRRHLNESTDSTGSNKLG